MGSFFRISRKSALAHGNRLVWIKVAHPRWRKNTQCFCRGLKKSLMLSASIVEIYYMLDEFSRLLDVALQAHGLKLGGWNTPPCGLPVGVILYPLRGAAALHHARSDCARSVHHGLGVRVLAALRRQRSEEDHPGHAHPWQRQRLDLAGPRGLHPESFRSATRGTSRRPSPSGSRRRGSGWSPGLNGT